MYLLLNKKTGLFSLLLVLFLVGCDEQQQEQKQNEVVEEVEPEQGVEKEAPTIDLEKSEVDFFTVCNNLEVWKGGIMGVESSDSTGPYIMGQCFGNKHFDLIVYSEKDIELSEASHNDLKKDLPGASYFAFEIPKVEKEEPEDEFDLYDYVYPSEVKVYKWMQGGWYLVKVEEVTSFEELGALKLKSIYL